MKNILRTTSTDRLYLINVLKRLTSNKAGKLVWTVIDGRYKRLPGIKLNISAASEQSVLAAFLVSPTKIRILERHLFRCRLCDKGQDVRCPRCGGAGKFICYAPSYSNIVMMLEMRAGRPTPKFQNIINEVGQTVVYPEEGEDYSCNESQIKKAIRQFVN